MEIEKIDIRYFKKDYMDRADMDGVCHVKILPWLSVVQAQQGSYDISLGDRQSGSTGAGGFFTASSGVQQRIVHRADPVSGRMLCRWVFLDVLINDEYSLDDLYDFPMIPSEIDELNALFDELFDSDNIFDNYACCYRIIKLILKDAYPKRDPCYKSLRPVIEYLEKNYSKPVSVAALAKEAHISESGLYSLFKKSYGISPIAYLNRYRISLAAEMLKSSDETITKIAASVGISDPFYFNKLFHKIYQTSPKKFRSSYRGKMR